MWYYIHSPGCGKPAFKMRRFPQVGEIIQARDFEHLNGSEITAGESIKCDSCGGYIPHLVLTCLEAVDDNQVTR